MVLVLAIVFATAGWFFSRLVLVRCLMVANILLTCLAATTELYVNDFLIAQGCNGHWMKGLSCPEWSILLRIVVSHDIFASIFILYLMYVFPSVWIGSAITEIVFRVGGASAPQPERKSN